MRKLFIVFVAILSMAMYSSALAKNITITARNLLVAKNCADNEEILSLPQDERNVLIELAKKIALSSKTRLCCRKTPVQPVAVTKDKKPDKPLDEDARHHS